MQYTEFLLDFSDTTNKIWTMCFYCSDISNAFSLTVLTTSWIFCIGSHYYLPFVLDPTGAFLALALFVVGLLFSPFFFFGCAYLAARLSKNESISFSRDAFLAKIKFFKPSSAFIPSSLASSSLSLASFSA